MSNCGGCEGLGSHTRWCPEVVGIAASMLGREAEAADNLADIVGGNCPAASNALYRAASLLRIEADRRMN